MATLYENKTFQAWLRMNQAEGILPKQCRRIIIDIGMDDIVKVYTEQYCDQSMFDVNLATLIKGAKIIPIRNWRQRFRKWAWGKLRWFRWSRGCGVTT